MHPYFIGYGPAFKKGFNVTQFMNLDLFPLMCYILGIEPTPNNGSFERVRMLLNDNGVKWNSAARFTNRCRWSTVSSLSPDLFIMSGLIIMIIVIYTTELARLRYSKV